MGLFFDSRTWKFEYINEYSMATRTHLCTQISEKLAQYWWDIRYCMNCNVTVCNDFAYVEIFDIQMKDTD